MRTALALLLAAAFALAACGGETETVTVTEGADTDEAGGGSDRCFRDYETPADISACQRGETPDPAVAPDPQAKYDFNCDNVLPDDIDSDDYQLIAGGTVENVGNVGVVVRVRVTWQVLGQPPIVEKRDVRVPYRRTRNVQISVLITGDQWDAHASADFDCATRASNVDFFGQVHE
jgi:hypothetical protein